MPSIEDSKQRLKDVQVLQGLSSALLEIASTKIITLRQSFETNQSFYDEISDLYRLVKSAAIVQGDRTDEVEESRKEVHVAVTSNKRFHGNLNKTVMAEFTDAIEEGDVDYYVIGYTGRHLVEHTEYRKYCKFLSFTDDYPTPKETQVFLERIKPYGKVVLHYPRFDNIFRQTPIQTDISYSPEVTISDYENIDINQIYEPELTYILSFFESQVRHLLFTRIMLESELSRTAARLVKMNSTKDRANSVITEERSTLRKETMIQEDIRLLETFSSRVQWGEK